MMISNLEAGNGDGPELTTAFPREQERVAFLLDAQSKAIQLFDEIERDLIRPGVSEQELSKEILDLGAKRHSIRTYWHKRVVRSGPHTLLPYEENSPDRMIEPDDILFVDLGPVFEAWEADFGRTFVLSGGDDTKHRLRDSLEPVWHAVRQRFLDAGGLEGPITGGQLYGFACEEARKAGWEFGGEIAGHLVGSFPHERIPKDMTTLFIKEGNNERMGNLGKDGMKRH